MAENLHGRRFLYKKADSDLRKIGSQAKKIVMKDFAGKFGALFFIWCGYKIDAPIFSPKVAGVRPELKGLGQTHT